MQNFNFHNTVKILFGEGKVTELSSNVPKGSKILMVYGGGSIKKNGVYEQVMNALQDFEVLEFGGIEANPHYETAIKAVGVVKKENVDFLLAVGGGSVVDATKFIAAASLYDGENAWDILGKQLPVREAIPLGVVLTLPATGTEMNKNAVMTKSDTQEKLAFYSPSVMPQFSILDPTFTYSLPQRQLVNGVLDAYIHVIEQYLTYSVDSPVQDRFSEGLLMTLIEEGRKAIRLEQPEYNNRANIAWSATMALNGVIASGVQECWATHKIGHELTAYHGLDHALTLSIVLPSLMEQLRDKRAAKILQYGERVWGIREGNVADRIDATIAQTEAFFRELGMKTKLSEHGIGQETIDRIINRFKDRGLTQVSLCGDVTLQDTAEVLARQL
jgi:NADP-dependent alcohol dehydrogenase